VYPVTHGIPRFVPCENYASSFGYQWTRFRQEQIDPLNGTRQSERRLRTETAWEPEWLKGRWILDAGCGAGRFLEVTSRTEECECVGVDISEAVDAAQDTLAGRSNVHLVQASILDLPFRPGSFDGVYCIGVIQHTPDPSQATRSLAGMVRPGGRIAVTMYERQRFTMLYSKYWIRPLSRRLRPKRLLALIRIVMPPVFMLTEVLFRIPLLKRVFRFLIPVADYVDATDLSMRQRYQWAILDTFDMLAPAYDIPQRESDVVGILAEGGVRDIQRLPNAGLNIVGQKA
tara:strand:+ start:5437 stop:6297 length:861 start_codon:yes stop_codon:yes gene_type:complete